MISAAILNFAGAFVSLEVAATIASGIVDTEAITLEIVLAGLVGAITWNLITWYLGLPSSSSHALIGGVVGSAVAAAGVDVVKWEGIREKVLVPSLVAPVAGFVVAAALMLGVTWIIRRRAPGLVNRFFRRLQLVSGGFVAFTHGTNDAQKTMGIIALALVASGHLAAGADPPTWVIVSAALAMGAGTYAGGWRIIKTLGTRIAKLDPPQGFAAQTSTAAILWTTAHYGFPVSTTHTITGSVMGAGASRRLSAVRWGVAGNILVAWVITIPCAALVGAAMELVTRLPAGDADRLPARRASSRRRVPRPAPADARRLGAAAARPRPLAGGFRLVNVRRRPCLRSCAEPAGWHIAPMKLALVARQETSTNRALVAAAASELDCELLTPEQALLRLGLGDAAICRLDVLPTLDGVDDGLWALGALEASGVRVLNPASAMLAAHDKLLTARCCGGPGYRIRARRCSRAIPLPPQSGPVVVKPRFGSWGRDVVRCDDDERAPRHALALGAAVVPQPRRARAGARAAAGHDLRLVVAGGSSSAPSPVSQRRASGGRTSRSARAAAGRAGGRGPGARPSCATAANADLIGVDLLPDGTAATRCSS